MHQGPRHDDVEGIRLLRAALERAEFKVANLRETLVLDGPFSRDPTELPVYLRLLPAESPFTTATKLFLLGMTLDGDEVERALAPLTIERLETMGVVLRNERGVESTMDLLPWGEFLLASDAVALDLPPSRGDYVLGLHPPSVALAKFSVREEIGDALDLGTGCGVQTLLAAEHARRVVGVDLNPRALAFAEFNAVLNGLENADFREGNTFDPVEGEQFDLIVSNPPYVISPESAYIFRDAGLSGDTFCEGLVRRAPAFLREGGYACMLISWAHGKDERWSDPVRRWVEGSGCDAIIFHTLSQDPLGYAATWNKTLRWDPVAYSKAIDRWIEYDASLGIEAIAWGAIALRRRDGGSNWFAEYQIGMDGIDPASDHLVRLFRAHDFLAGLGEGDGILDSTYRLAPEHLIDQSLHVRERTGLIRNAVFRLDGGFNFQVELDRQALQLVTHLDGELARDVVAMVAEAADEAGRAEFLKDAPGFVRRLVELGFLLPDEAAPR